MASKSREERVAEYQAESRKADDLVLTGRKEDALAVLRESMSKAATADDEDYGLFFQAELINYYEPDYPKQIELMNKAVRNCQEKGIPPDSFILRQLGVYHSLSGDEASAIECYDRALAENPRDWNAMRNKGVSLLKMDEEDEAIQWYDRALAENPRDWNAMRDKGVSLSRRGEEDEAMQWFDRALAENPSDWNAMRQKGVSLSKKDEEDEAIEWFDRALAKNPRDWNSMRQKGVSFSKKGEEDEAMQWFDRALAENPIDGNAMNGKGVSFSKKGQEDEAIQWFDRALAENPRDWNAMNGKGVSFSKKGQEDEAIQWFDRALAENPRDWNATRNKGVSHSNLGHFDAALEWIDRALELRPDDLNSLRSRAIVLGLTGRTEEAVRILRDCLKVKPNDKTARLWLTVFLPAEEKSGQIKDITREDQQEQARIEQEATDRALKLEAWRSLSARSAHRMGNQIFFMLGTLRTLRKQSTEEMREAVEDLSGSLDRMRQIVQEFQSFSANEQPKLQPTQPAPLIKEVVQRYAKLQSSLTIRTEIPESLPVCLLDRRQIDQVLGELLENANHHVPPGGSVKVTADTMEVPGGRRVRIVVEDTGPGVLQEHKSRIFEPFFSKRSGGTGLGLAMVAQTIGNHGGLIRETGSPGQGARFEIELPARTGTEE